MKLSFNATISGSSVTGGSVIADTGPWVKGAIPNNSVGWQLTANVFKYGAGGANTQYAQGSAILGGVHSGISAPMFMTAVKSAAIVIAVTGSSFISGVANDVVATWFAIDAMN